MKFFNRDTWKSIYDNLGMKVTQASPEIMLVTGAVSLLIGTVLACTKTDKTKEILSETKKEALEAEKNLNVDETNLLPETKRQLKIEKGRAYCRIYGKMMYEFLKIYGIPALLWFGGMGLIVGGHGSLRKMNRTLAADIFAGNQLLKEYRERVKKAVGEEVEEKIFFGSQEGMVTVVETDEKTGEKKVSKQKADIFYAQPGSIFARNFTEETTDVMWRTFTDDYLQARINEINTKLDVGYVRAYNGLDILRMLGFNENALGEDESLDALLHYGISGNARKVPDPEMRKLKVTKLRGYQERWDNEAQSTVYVPCLRIDFNFYPLEGKI